MLKAVLFDLDGTLVDTAPDLLGALDDVRAGLGLPACAHLLPAAVAARGGRGILALGLPQAYGSVEELLPIYLALYERRLARMSRPYAGIEALLDALAARGVRLGIVSNKPQALAERLLDLLGWRARFDALVGGDSLGVRKPAPDPVWRACRLLGVSPVQTAVIGDDERDIAAARAAGCGYSVAAAYGYLEAGASAAQWGADAIVDSPCELLSLLRPRLYPQPAPA
ncbi:MAG: HAD-IA family hydrolase [Xanthomonadales bacterium]|nr:N-acetylmuramic acid 6-phosphate phosphatase [Anaerolineae bacterium]MCC6592709.1 HAD-IA family hydrolase [Xanthomonadales bacterium]